MATTVFFPTFATQKKTMERLFFIITLCIAAMTADAQIRKGQSVIGITFGLGNFYYGKTYETATPPLMLSYEYGHLRDAFDVDGLSIGIGGCVGYTGAASKTPYGNATLTSRVNECLIAFKASGHYDFFQIPKLDLYASVLLGWGIAGSSNSWEGDEETIAIARSLGWENQDKVGGPLFGIVAGARYWLTENFGGNAEIGYGPAFLNIGCCLTF